MGQRPRKWTPNDPPNCPLIDLSPFPGSLTHSGQYFDFPWPPLPTRSSFGVQNGLYMGPTYSITCFTVLYAYSLYPVRGKLLFPQHLPGSSNGVFRHPVTLVTSSDSAIPKFPKIKSYALNSVEEATLNKQTKEMKFVSTVSAGIFFLAA